MVEQEQEKALLPASEDTVDFYGDPIGIAIVDDLPYVAVRPICDYLGVSWSGQRRRINRDAVLTRSAATVRMTAADGKQRDMLALPLKHLPGWLFGLDPSRAREEVRGRLTLYREECFEVLWNAYRERSSEPRPAPTGNRLALEQIRNVSLAVARMAEEMMDQEMRLTSVEEDTRHLRERLDEAARFVGGLQRRLATVEERTAPRATISEDQADVLKAEITALAELLTDHEPGKNHFQSVYRVVYQQFSVSSYKRIRNDDYDDVLQFLRAWQARIDSGVA